MPQRSTLIRHQEKCPCIKGIHLAARARALHLLHLVKKNSKTSPQPACKRLSSADYETRRHRDDDIDPFNEREVVGPSPPRALGIDIESSAMCELPLRLGDPVAIIDATIPRKLSRMPVRNESSRASSAVRNFPVRTIE